MQRNYYVYKDKDLGVHIAKLPVWFSEAQKEGDADQGSIVFHSNNEYDEVWGPNAKIQVDWENKARTDFYHAREVQESIDMYNAINVVVTNKKREWLRSHEFTYWFGNRKKMIRKHYYPEEIIHGIFYCEVKNRQYTLNARVIKKHYEGFKPYILEAFKSIICH
ncbi:MAG: hypothetical protein ACOC44_10155 [Promethearchaeia archaeon]